MARTNIWQDGTKTIPKDEEQSTGRFHRIGLGKEDIGARKSHTRGAAKKNSNSLRHV